MKQDNFVKFNEWLDTCPFGDYITNKLDYDPKTKYWEFRVKVPNISKALRDSYTDTTAQFYTKQQPLKCNPIEYKRIMTYDSEHYYAVQTFLEDDELCKIWNIIEIAMNREGYDVSNAELSMRLYDNELEENIEHDMENLL